MLLLTPPPKKSPPLPLPPLSPMTDCRCERISAVIAVRISEWAPFVMEALTLGQEGRVAEEAGAAAAAAFSCCCCCCCCCFGEVRLLVPPRAADAAATLTEV